VKEHTITTGNYQGKVFMFSENPDICKTISSELGVEFLPVSGPVFVADMTGRPILDSLPESIDDNSHRIGECRSTILGKLNLEQVQDDMAYHGRDEGTAIALMIKDVFGANVPNPFLGYMIMLNKSVFDENTFTPMTEVILRYGHVN
jgi:hypothetical protein